MSYPGGRMPIWRSQDKIRQQWLYTLCTADALAALFTLFGRAEGASWRLLNAILPTTPGTATAVWSALLAACSACILFGFNRTGAAAGAVVWSALTGRHCWRSPPGQRCGTAAGWRSRSSPPATSGCCTR